MGDPFNSNIARLGTPNYCRFWRDSGKRGATAYNRGAQIRDAQQNPPPMTQC